MTNELTKTFAFEAYDIRIIVENGEPLFCASDVCKALGYGNPSEALRKHCVEGGITKRDTPTSSGVQPMTYINEPNLYRLITRSKMPHAVKFQDWVFEEVLPTIRKTGTYGKTPAFQIPQTMQEALRLAADQNGQERRASETDRSGRAKSLGLRRSRRRHRAFHCHRRRENSAYETLRPVYLVKAQSGCLSARERLASLFHVGKEAMGRCKDQGIGQQKDRRTHHQPTPSLHNRRNLSDAQDDAGAENQRSRTT